MYLPHVLRTGRGGIVHMSTTNSLIWRGSNSCEDAVDAMVVVFIGSSILNHHLIDIMEVCGM
jgi:hypothetical protein